VAVNRMISMRGDEAFHENREGLPIKLGATVRRTLSSRDPREPTQLVAPRLFGSSAWLMATWGGSTIRKPKMSGHDSTCTGRSLAWRVSRCTSTCPDR